MQHLAVDVGWIQRLQEEPAAKFAAPIASSGPAGAFLRSGAFATYRHPERVDDNDPVVLGPVLPPFVVAAALVMSAMSPSPIGIGRNSSAQEFSGKLPNGMLGPIAPDDAVALPDASVDTAVRRTSLQNPNIKVIL